MGFSAMRLLLRFPNPTNMSADLGVVSATAETRRSFLKKTGVAAAVLAGARLAGLAAESPPPIGGSAPWYRRARRWGQTKITEADPAMTSRGGVIIGSARRCRA